MPPSAPQNELCYQCPGERSPISHAQHLARLAVLYPACRECEHRHDTGVLSARIKRQIERAGRRPIRRRLFEAEWAGGIYLNELTLADAQKFSAALGVIVQRERHRRETSPVGSPRVVLASDGTSLAPEVLAAASAGLRWAGCQVVEIGQATAPSAAQAIVQLAASGGVLVGNFRARPHEVGLMFWGPDARPLSAGGTLDELERLAGGPLSRPVRHSAGATRGRNEAEYVAGLQTHYHALRPLRFALEAESTQWRLRLQSLLEHVACTVVPVASDRPGVVAVSKQGEGEAPAEPNVRPKRVPGSAGASPSQDSLETSNSGKLARVRHAVRTSDAHFGVWTDAAGERLGVVDEHGQAIPTEQLLVALAESLLAEFPDGAVVVEAETPAAVCDALTAAGARVFLSGSTREAMDRSLREHLALLGGGPSGRLYFCGQPPAADSLLALTHLLVKLSQSDRPLSRVVRDAMGSRGGAEARRGRGG